MEWRYFIAATSAIMTAPGKTKEGSVMRMLRVTACVFIGLFSSVGAMALSNRVFVSPAGADAGGCPIASPCRTFAYALTQVNAGGEVIALDTAGYGPMVINKAVTVVAAPGATAFIAVGPGGTGIAINAATNDVVNLRGLALSGNTSNAGIDFQAGQAVNVEHCVINGFGHGIYMLPQGDVQMARMQVSHSVVRNNTDGIVVGIDTSAPDVPSARAVMTLTNCEIKENTNVGVDAQSSGRVAISDSMISGNSIALAAGSVVEAETAIMSLDRCEITQNATGIQAGTGIAGRDANSFVRVANCKISFNLVGLLLLGDGEINSRTAGGVANVLLNTVEDNDTNGAFSGTYAAK